MIQIRFDGRSFDQLPLSPAHRTPVFATEPTRFRKTGKLVTAVATVTGALTTDDSSPFPHRPSCLGEATVDAGRATAALRTMNPCRHAISGERPRPTRPRGP